MLLAILILMLWLLPVILHAIFMSIAEESALIFKPPIKWIAGYDPYNWGIEIDTDDISLYEAFVYLPADESSYDGAKVGRRFVDDEAPMITKPNPILAHIKELRSRTPQWETHHGKIFKPPSQIHNYIEMMNYLQTEMQKQLGIPKDRI